MASRYPTFSETGTYADDAKVLFEGLIYQNISGGTINPPSTDPDQSADWQIVAVNEIINYNSLIEAIRIELNTDDDQINDSIPFFIQMAEESFTTRIRVPIQRRIVTMRTDSQGRIRIPYDLLNVINLRYSTQTAGGTYLQERGRVELLAGNYEEYIELSRYYTTSFFGIQSRVDKYEGPIYWYDGDYFWIAPQPEENTEVELIYYASIPRLGSVQNRVNNQGEALNAEGQTLAQWIASGNSANSFVQEQITVERNWFTAAAPQMLLYGALVNADLYLKNDNRIDIWRQKFALAEAETQAKVDMFKTERAHTMQVGNIYTV